MPSNKKVSLDKINTLTFHKDAYTSSRRTQPIPQLTCIGTPCDIFQPETVQCANMGDDGTGNIQWKCDADLPSSLRLGRVEVSCEGWASPGDRHILQGSCGLTYNLHRTDSRVFPGQYKSASSSSFERLVEKAFNWIFLLVLVTLVYSLIRSLLIRFWPTVAPPPASSFFPWGGDDHHHGGGGGGGDPGGGGGGPDFAPGPPPPYSKDETFSHPESSTSAPASGGSGPGFWTGLAAGGAAAYLATNRRSAAADVRERNARFDRYRDDDGQGAGSSGLGEMRRATGFGGTSNR